MLHVEINHATKANGGKLLALSKRKSMKKTARNKIQSKSEIQPYFKSGANNALELNKPIN